MKINPIAEVKSHLSEFIQKCKDEPIVITKNGRAAAVLVPVTDDSDLERLVLINNPHFRKLLSQAEKRIRSTGGIKHTDFWKRV